MEVAEGRLRPDAEFVEDDALDRMAQIYPPQAWLRFPIRNRLPWRPRHSPADDNHRGELRGSIRLKGGQESTLVLLAAMARETVLAQQLLHLVLHNRGETAGRSLYPTDDQAGAIGPRHAAALVHHMGRVEPMERP
jgi:hypothetical protein